MMLGLTFQWDSSECWSLFWLEYRQYARHTIQWKMIWLLEWMKHMINPLTRISTLATAKHKPSLARGRHIRGKIQYNTSPWSSISNSWTSQASAGTFHIVHASKTLNSLAWRDNTPRTSIRRYENDANWTTSGDIKTRTKTFGKNCRHWHLMTLVNSRNEPGIRMYILDEIPGTDLESEAHF